MDSFNKVLSFVLGLVIVIVFIVILSNRLNLGKKFLPFQTGAPTPKTTPRAKRTTPTPSIYFYSGQGEATTSTTSQTKGGQQATQTQPGKLKTIPSTGSPTEALLLLGSTFLLGIYLRKKTA